MSYNDFLLFWRLLWRPFCSHFEASLRRERDSNPRYLAVQRISRPPHSTTLPSLLWSIIRRGDSLHPTRSLQRYAFFSVCGNELEELCGCDPGGTQTLDLQNRNLTLYSTKLLSHFADSATIKSTWNPACIVALSAQRYEFFRLLCELWDGWFRSVLKQLPPMDP